MKKGEVYGMEVVMDVYDCDPEVIKSAKQLKIFVTKMCQLLDMKKYGNTLVHHFGHSCPKTSGYSLLQFIETSSITGHFSELWNTAYINIFSCRMFDAKKTVNFTKKFFKAKRVTSRAIVRK